MRGETQASRLETMMRQHSSMQVYDVSLPPVKIKSGISKNLKCGMLVLLPVKSPRLVLCKEGSVQASLLLDPCKKTATITQIHSKKNRHHTEETLFCLFGSLSIKEAKEGTVVDMVSLDLERVALTVAGRCIAHGRLVWVDSKIAVEIEKSEE